MTTTMHRAEYMRANTPEAHRQFYAGILALAGISLGATHRLVAKSRGLEWPYNEVYLPIWDTQGAMYWAALAPAFRAVGDSISPAGVVCCMKEAVRQQLEREEAMRDLLVAAVREAPAEGLTGKAERLAGLKLLQEPEVFMCALANEPDHFFEYAARVAYDGAFDAFNPEADREAFAQFIESCTVPGTTGWAPTQSAMLRKVCDKVHTAINERMKP